MTLKSPTKSTIFSDVIEQRIGQLLLYNTALEMWESNKKDEFKRSMRGDEAKEVCLESHLVQVPVVRGKSDLTIYRDASSEVVSILARKGRCECASIDAAEKILKKALESLESLDENVLKSLG
ncbi:DNA polymerase eta [Tanacetum coccineum]